MNTHSFNTLEELVLMVAEGVRPPERMSVPEAAAKYRMVNNPGSYVGPWKNEMTPYLIEPQEVLTDLDKTSSIFVGPAQSGKTDIFLNWLLSTVRNDPADTMLVNTSQATARDFSMRRVDRLHRSTPEVKSRLMRKGRHGDNTFDKMYSTGMILNMSWPSVNELSGKPIPRIWLTDYDRMDQDVDGEGTPFSLSMARITSFRSHGMVAAESSPGFEVTDPGWVPSSAHEAPPTQGILALYNGGDRRRWYWRCVSCSTAFIPNYNMIQYPASDDILECAEQAYIACPSCGHIYHHDPVDGDPGKHEMNQRYEDGGHSKWIKDGQVWARETGEVVGDIRHNDRASFWLNGVCATFTDWRSLVQAQLTAEAEYESTGSELTLKTVVNTKLGDPYTPKAQAMARMPDAIRSRAEDLGTKEVPWGVRFLLAAIDIQKNRFVVQVHGIYDNGDVAVVDRFEIKYSLREQEDNPGQFQYVNPGAYAEDWRLLVPELLMKTYPLQDNSGREMAIKMVISDSGGQEGVTHNAYEFFRWLRKGYEDSNTPQDIQEKYPYVPGLDARFLLLKGDRNLNAPRIRLNYPDSQRKDKHAGARGEIPVLMINPSSLKNQLDQMLDREEKGGTVRFAKWLPINFYKELTVETKDKTGRWVNPLNYRNESWDLLTYTLALMLYKEIGYDYIDWAHAPTWAQEWDMNDLVFDPEDGNNPLEGSDGEMYGLEELGKLLS